jgi:hypothetical protein
MSLIFREGDTNRLLQEMHNSEHDIHAMIVYPDKRILTKLYTDYISKVLQTNMLAVYVSHYETINAVRNNFIKSGALSNEGLKEYEKTGSLLVLDNVKTHFGHEFDILSITKLLSKRAENQRKRGAVIMADMGWYYLEDNVDGLIENELQMPKRAGMNCSTFCLYHKGDFETLSADQQDMLRDSHLKSLEISTM